MAFVQPSDGALNYFLCHYGRSRLTYRGPRRDLSGEYLAVLGGTETYGRFVMAPYAALVEERLGIPVANLGCQNAGPDVYLCDRGAMEVAAGARVAVLQVMGAQNLTNRYYTVHPRRNDRFVAATPLLRSMYREVDFTEFHFTRHLISALWALGEERFAPIRAELKLLWVERMIAILARLPKRSILFWTADHPPPEGDAGPEIQPMFVDRAMIEVLKPHASAYVEHVVTPAARAEGLSAMRFLPQEEPAAEGLPGAAVHQEAADRLMPLVERLL
ncbi:DUF6473 family protein [Xinfangfangia pollutisoli]|uniref:DUF6473 family protein n=1 Tax=Xinfangfangia pollutisoli TaxID=2865960 RepID=UPI001CD3B173|nr:DUF6473 family protein [Xinfangfangia pollutisoli]